MKRASPRSIGLPLACALAYAGAVVGYTPLLTLLLPAAVTGVAGEGRYATLALVLAFGAVTAAAANLIFGWLSDRSLRQGGGRRRWIAYGLAAMPVSFAALSVARDVTAIVIAVAAFQIAINAVLAPLLALVAEEVPPDRMGLTTGLFAAGPLLAALVSLAFAAPGLSGIGERLAVIVATSAACLSPLLLTRSRTIAGQPVVAQTAPAHRDLSLALAARLFVQIAGNVLFADLLYLMELQGVASSAATARIGTLLMLANLLPLPIAVGLGRWSDWLPSLKITLFAAAAGAAAGLVAMAASSGWNGRAIGFLLFATGWGVFLPLQVGQVMRLLPDPNHRGRDLGVLNLANTLPVLIGQGLAWWLATPKDVTALLLALAGLTSLGGALTLVLRPR